MVYTIGVHESSNAFIKIKQGKLYMNNTKNITKRQQQAAESRKRIFDSAMKLINNKGFENVSISDICKSAKCSVGTFYHYFPSKDDLIMSA